MGKEIFISHEKSLVGWFILTLSVLLIKQMLIKFGEKFFEAHFSDKVSN